MDCRDDIQRDYEDLKARFKGSNFDQFHNGDWFAHIVQWLLESYAKQVDAAYIRQHYPGVSPANQAKKAIQLAARFNAIAGGMSASGVTALELSSLGPQALATIPATGALVMADVAYSTRTQLRTTYDLSVIHSAPLAVDDVEDCYLVFLTAMGAKVQEMTGGLGKAVGPHVVAYNVRKLLRAGVRKTLQELLKKIGGAWLAKKLTERALMRLLVPGINIPIASKFNHYFTKKVLLGANRTMYRRGEVVRPLVRLYTREQALPKTTAIKALIAVIETGDPDGWSEEQMNALRYCQQTLVLSDSDMSDLDEYFDRQIEDVLKEVTSLAPPALSDLAQLTMVASALFPDDRYDVRYGEAIAKISARSSVPMPAAEVSKRIQRLRSALLGGKTIDEQPSTEHAAP